jgi:hypothetical protein
VLVCCLIAVVTGASMLRADDALTPVHTSASDAELDKRLRFLEERLEASRLHGQIWYWSWMSIDVGSAVWLGVQAGLDDNEDDAVNNAVNAGLGVIGVADLLLRPLQARHGAEPIRGLPEQTRDQKIEKVRAAERLLHGNAERAEDRTSLAMHAGNVALNGAAGLIVGLAGRPSDGLITFGAGTAGGVINLLSAPWRPARDWKEYQAFVHGGGGEASTRFDVALTPLAGGAHLALRLTW